MSVWDEALVVRAVGLWCLGVRGWVGAVVEVIAKREGAGLRGGDVGKEL